MKTEMPIKIAMQALGVFAMQEPTPDKVQQMFRRLSLRRHPDKGGDAASFARLVEARRAVLSDWDLVIALHQQDQRRKAEAEAKKKARTIDNATINDKVARITMSMDAFNAIFIELDKTR